MYPFSVFRPKPLLPVCNQSIVEYQIAALAKLGVKRLIVVIGHKGYEITRELGDGQKFGVAIEYYEQEQILGIAHAVGQLEPLLNTPFLLLLGDIFFEFQNLQQVLEQKEERGASAVIAVREEEDAAAVRKNFAVILDDDGYVRRVIEKPRYAKTKLKGCGLYLFDLPIFDAIRRTPRTAMRDEYEITDALQTLIDDDHKVIASHCVSWDMNLTFPADLLECNLRLLAEQKLEYLVHPTAHVHPGATLTNVVVGKGATIANPVTLTDSVIFPRTNVVSTRNLDRMIITPEEVIDCRTPEAKSRT